MKCKKCGGEVEIDFTKQLLSDPPKYEAKCKECGDITYPLCSECHSTEGSCLQSVYGAGKINDVLWNGESITKIKSNYPYNYQKPTNETCEPNYYYESNKPTDIHSGFYQQGWVCPKCGGVYSPYQNYCPNCSPTQNIRVTN